MATWEDGPEYAPVVRPDDFATAPVPPLEQVPPAVQPAAQAPADRPQFSGPQGPIVPLTALVPEVGDQRDPQRPFDVASSTLTSMDSAWGAAHYNAPGQPAGLVGPAAAVSGPAAQTGLAPVVPPGAGPSAGGWGAPGVTPPAAGGWAPSGPWPTPATPFPPTNAPAPPPGGFPPPGTPQWFGPGPAPLPQQPRPPRTDARAVLEAATPGLCICLAIGGLIYVLAPIMLGVAFVLSRRVKVASNTIEWLFKIALGFLAFFALAGFMAGRFWFTDWWGFVGGWALVLCWVVLITVLVLVYRGLRTGQPRPPTSGYTSNWG